ncbi:phage protease [Roseospira goensis]|uniref:Phage I-like protein n=1 Tax=Roseospira goensis TaxID=391922 RepID=A0A7W6S3L1_9PROT|nr:phage protease [Roseospira goensis]MBB4287740.1 phage I-like protein [Roseospira goensis]
METSPTHTPAALAALAVPAPQAGDAAAPAVPDWIQVLPAGRELRGHDGRGPYIVADPQAIVAEFDRRRSVNKADMIIDWEHGSERAGADGGAPAAGWIDRLEVRDGAVWGHVSRWTPRAAAQIAAGEYRYLSPVILHRPDGAVVGVRSVALTSDPNLGIAALNRAGAADVDALRRAVAGLSAADLRDIQWERQLMSPDTTPHTPDLSPLAHALGLSPAASVSAMCTAVDKLKGDVTAAQQKAETPDPERFVSKADHQKTKDELAAAQKAMAERDEAVIEAEVQAAIQAGKVPPADKDYHLAACKAEGGLDRFRKVVAAAQKAGITKPVTMPTRPAGAGGITPQAAAQKAQAYQAEMRGKGITVSTSDAVAHVMQGG